MLNHLGIIMDGNRRWAKARFLPSFVGHEAGVKNLEKIIELCQKKLIKYVTIWALSIDNLKRSKEELDKLFGIFNSMETKLQALLENNVRFDTIGNLSLLPAETRKVILRMTENTKNNTGLTMTVAFAYGGQDEIVRATKKIIKSGVNPDNLNREEFRKYLDIGKLPVIDLIIRTGGDIRHSGFLLYDCEYSEYYFSQKFWPDFDEEELNNAIESFAKSRRNFGK